MQTSAYRDEPDGITFAKLACDGGRRQDVATSVWCSSHRTMVKEGNIMMDFKLTLGY